MNAYQRRPLGGSMAVHRVLLALVAIPLVLVGMLLMHVVTSDGAAPATAGSVVASVQELHSDPGVAVDPFQPQPTFEELACILALLAGALVLAMPALTSHLRDGLSATSVRPPDISFAQPGGPNLHVLSISRT